MELALTFCKQVSGRLGELVGSHVIANPAEDADEAFLAYRLGERGM